MNQLEPFTERNRSAVRGFDKLSPNGCFKFKGADSIMPMHGKKDMLKQLLVIIDAALQHVKSG